MGFIVAKDENLTKAHVRFLESKLIQLANEAGSVKLANGTAPDFTRLPEADLSDMTFFLDQMQIVLPLIGLDLFRPSGGQALARTEATTSRPIFELMTLGTHATAQETDAGFVVIAGSTAMREGTQSFPAGYRVLRDQLLGEGKLVESDEPTLYRFTTDVPFASPSAAASVVMARSASGPLEWKVRGTGETYKAWRSSQLEN